MSALLNRFDETDTQRWLVENFDASLRQRVNGPTIRRPTAWLAHLGLPSGDASLGDAGQLCEFSLGKPR
jgi:hypothetical protein